MSKNRTKQRINRQKGRYFKALAASEDLRWQEDGYFSEEIKRTNEFGLPDLTAYNAIKMLDDDDWILVYK